MHNMAVLFCFGDPKRGPARKSLSIGQNQTVILTSGFDMFSLRQAICPSHEKAMTAAQMEDVINGAIS